MGLIFRITPLCRTNIITHIIITIGLPDMTRTEGPAAEARVRTEGGTAGITRTVVAEAAAAVVAVSEAAEAGAATAITAAAVDEEEGQEAVAAAAPAAEEVGMAITGRSTIWAMLAVEEEEEPDTDKGTRFRTCSLRTTTVGMRVRVRVWSRGRTTLLFCREVGLRSGMGLGLGMAGRVLGWNCRINNY